MRKVKLTLKEALESGQAIQAIAHAAHPAITAWRLARIGQALNVEIGRAMEIVQEVNGRLGPDEDATEEERRAAIDRVKEELDPLLAEEVEIRIPVIDPYKLGDVNVRPVDLMTLDWIFSNGKKAGGS